MTRAILNVRRIAEQVRREQAHFMQGQMAMQQHQQWPPPPGVPYNPQAGPMVPPTMMQGQPMPQVPQPYDPRLDPRLRQPRPQRRPPMPQQPVEQGYANPGGYPEPPTPPGETMTGGPANPQFPWEDE